LIREIDVLSDDLENQKIPNTLKSFLRILKNEANSNDVNSNEKLKQAFKSTTNMKKEILDWIDKHCQQLILKKIVDDKTVRKTSNSGLNGVWGVPGRK